MSPVLIESNGNRLATIPDAHQGYFALSQTHKVAVYSTPRGAKADGRIPPGVELSEVFEGFRKNPPRTEHIIGRSKTEPVVIGDIRGVIYTARFVENWETKKFHKRRR